MGIAKSPPATDWRSQDPSTFTWKQRILTRTDRWSNEHGEFPIFQKTDKMPRFDPWSVDRWIVTHAAWPVAVHAAWNHYIGPYFLGPLPVLLAGGLYALGLTLNMGREIRALEMIASKTGFLDGDKHGRDKVPELHFSKIIASVPSIIAARTSMTVLLAYRPSAPIALSPWFLAELTLYPIVLDFFFYIYHRATHEIDGLWKYHRTHHLTKHPNPLLSSYADVEQEIIEMAIVPLLTYATLKLLFGFPMTFYDWWLCQCFTFFAEAIGHSGLRAMFQVPGPGGHVMKLIGCELVLEDHDLHHRQGWRKSGNYGKATRLWDRVFGTCLPRIEAQWDNVDYEGAIRMPIF